MWNFVNFCQLFFLALQVTKFWQKLIKVTKAHILKKLSAFCHSRGLSLLPFKLIYSLYPFYAVDAFPRNPRNSNISVSRIWRFSAKIQFIVRHFWFNLVLLYTLSFIWYDSCRTFWYFWLLKYLNSLVKMQLITPTNRRDTSNKMSCKSCLLISNENTLNTSAISIMIRLLHWHRE